MRLDTSKTTVVLVVSENNNTLSNFRDTGSRIQTKTEISYLGTKINKNWDQTQEIRIGIGVTQL